MKYTIFSPPVKEQEYISFVANRVVADIGQKGSSLETWTIRSAVIMK